LHHGIGLVHQHAIDRHKSAPLTVLIIIDRFDDHIDRLMIIDSVMMTLKGRFPLPHNIMLAEKNIFVVSTLIVLTPIFFLLYFDPPLYT